MPKETNITERIKYDSNAQHILKNYTPRIAKTSVAGGLAAILVGVPVLALSGVAAGIFAGVIATVGAGAGVTLANVYYNRVVFRKQFKKLEGKTENLDEIVNFISEYENSAKDLRQALNNHKGESKITLMDANGNPQLVSVRKVNKWIRENEEMVYQGLKYLYDKALVYSNALRDYSNRKLTEKEENEVQDIYDKLAVIGKITVDVTRDRVDYNPYKKLIMDSLHKGCKIGVKKEFGRYVTNDHVNTLIEGVRGTKNIEDVAKLYSSVYEQPAFEKLAKEQEAKNKAQETINSQHQKYLDAIALLDKLNNKSSKLTKEERELKAEAEKLAYNFELQAQVNDLIKVAKTYRSKLQESDKQELDKAVDIAKRALDTKENGAMLLTINNLGKLIESAQAIVEQDAYKSGQDSKKGVIDAYKAQMRRYVAKIDALINEVSGLENSLDRAEIMADGSLRNLNQYVRMYNELKSKAVKGKELSASSLATSAKTIQDFYKQFDASVLSDEDKEKLTRIATAVSKGTKITPQQITQAFKDIDELQLQAYAILDHQLSKAKDIIAEESKRANAAVKRADEQAKRADESDKNLARKQELLKMAAHQVLDLRQENKTLQKIGAKAEKLDQENTELELKLKDLKKKYLSMKNVAKKAIELIEGDKELITALENEQKMYQAKIDMLDKRLTSREDEIANRNNAISDLHDEISTLTGQILDKNKVVEDLTRNVTGLEADKLRLNQLLQEATEALRRNEAQNIADKEACAKETAELELKNKKLQDELSSAKSSKRRIKDDLRKKVAENEALREEMAYEIHKRTRTQEELERSTKEFKQALEEVVAKNQDLETALQEEREDHQTHHEKEALARYNFEQGRDKRFAKGVLDKMIAHIEYTLDTQSDNYDVDAIRDLEYYVDLLESKVTQDYDEDIKERAKHAINMYNKAYASRLAPISDKDLAVLTRGQRAKRKEAEKNYAKNSEKIKRQQEDGHSV